MTKFLTISPTHIPGKKPYAWDNFLKGNYVSIGWMDVDLTGWSIDKIILELKKRDYANESSAIDSFKKFMSLDIGDIVAVNNVNAGLFGIGRIKSDYKFSVHIHDTGAENKDEFYSHYKEVEWIVTEYKRRKEILKYGEKPWVPYGTTGYLELELPDYIKRLINIPVKEEDKENESFTPEYLNDLVQNINVLKKDVNHQERAHESLVEDFLVQIGYKKHSDIKYRQSRIDLTIWDNNKPLLLLEVKRDWDLSWERNADALKQAYGYSYDKGIRYIILTNGDYYAIFDRLKGLSYEKNLIIEFQLTALIKDDIEFIDKLKKEYLTKPNISEIFKNLSEMFEDA